MQKVKTDRAEERGQGPTKRFAPPWKHAVMVGRLLQAESITRRYGFSTTSGALHDLRGKLGPVMGKRGTVAKTAVDEVDAIFSAESYGIKQRLPECVRNCSDCEACDMTVVIEGNRVSAARSDHWAISRLTEEQDNIEKTRGYLFPASIGAGGLVGWSILRGTDAKGILPYVVVGGIFALAMYIPNRMIGDLVGIVRRIKRFNEPASLLSLSEMRWGIGMTGQKVAAALDSVRDRFRESWGQKPAGYE
jgi:hypothetical protein